MNVCWPALFFWLLGRIAVVQGFQSQYIKLRLESNPKVTGSISGIVKKSDFADSLTKTKTGGICGRKWRSPTLFMEPHVRTSFSERGPPRGPLKMSSLSQAEGSIYISLYLGIRKFLASLKNALNRMALEFTKALVKTGRVLKTTSIIWLPAVTFMLGRSGFLQTNGPLLRGGTTYCVTTPDFEGPARSWAARRLLPVAAAAAAAPRAAAAAAAAAAALAAAAAAGLTVRRYLRAVRAAQQQDLWKAAPPRSSGAAGSTGGAAGEALSSSWPPGYRPAFADTDPGGMGWWLNAKDSEYQNLVIPPQYVYRKSKAQSVERGVRARVEGVRERVRERAGALAALGARAREGDWEDVGFQAMELVGGQPSKWDDEDPESWTVSFNSPEKKLESGDLISDKPVAGSKFQVRPLPAAATPALVLVNPRSGGGAGAAVLAELRALLNPLQVVDLTEKGQPERALKEFAHLPRLRLVVAGGDGTVGWVLKAWENLSLGPVPPIGVVPLGTGNDLARTLGWGGGLSAPGGDLRAALGRRLADLQRASVALVDRWAMRVQEPGARLGVPGWSARRRVPRRRPPPPAATLSFSNYFSLGVDAQAALRFHSVRDSNPHLFFNRLTNKMMYAVLGADEVARRSCANIGGRVRVFDEAGRELRVPARAEGLVFLNINSYSGGVSMWSSEAVAEPLAAWLPENSEGGSGGGGGGGGGVNKWAAPSSRQDGMLDVVAVYGAFHLGQLQMGLASAEKVGQCRAVRLATNDALPMQVDGEPWVQEKCVIRIQAQPDKIPMLMFTKEGGEVVEDVQYALDNALAQNFINSTQHGSIMAEISNRIEQRHLRASVQPWTFNI